MRCGSCNTVVAGDASFCPRCGASLAEAAPAPGPADGAQAGWGQPQPPPPPQAWGQPPAAAAGWQQTPPPAWGPPTTTPQTNGMAIASLICGIASIAMCLGPFASVPALITGYKAREEIDRGGGVQQGRGMAVAGIVLGWVGVGVTAVAVLAFIVLAVVNRADTSSSMLHSLG